MLLEVDIKLIMTRENLLLTAINAAIEAGKEILTVYSTEFQVENKADKSPLTEADKRAHQAIVKGLTSTNLPILSEEGKSIPYDERKSWEKFWMVDPLDGTKEFINKNGEFTVNIALIENQQATMGVIYVPVTQELYFSDEKAYKINNITTAANTLTDLINTANELPLKNERADFVVVASRSHMSDETKTFINKKEAEHKSISLLSKGSSLKLCMIAENAADCYPRFAPTMEWDTAAGNAIINAAGGIVIDQTTQEKMKYNKENLLNNWFLAQLN